MLTRLQAHRAALTPMIKQKFKVGDYVRLQQPISTFAKSSQPRFSREVFHVDEVKQTEPQPSYVISINTRRLEGSYPQNRLVLVPPQDD